MRTDYTDKAYKLSAFNSKLEPQFEEYSLLLDPSRYTCLGLSPINEYASSVEQMYSICSYDGD